MSKVLLGIVAVLLAISYYLYSQNQILQSNNVALESAVATQEEAIKSIQADLSCEHNSYKTLMLKVKKHKEN